MNQHLNREKLNELLQAEQVDQLTPAQLEAFVLTEKEIHTFAPDGICQTDPRNGDRIVYNSARARRPHDNKAETTGDNGIQAEKACRICDGLTTRVVDVAELSEGFTFINKNLFPIFYPESNVKYHVQSNLPVMGNLVHGVHFLQWTSSYHERDWHNMPQADRIIVLQRMAALESKLLEESGGYVSIIKNYGQLVGGSLTHGHQQIGASNILPNRIRQDQVYMTEHDETFNDYMLRENPQVLLIKDYGPAVLLTPYFMRRPFDMQLILKDNTKSHLFDLSEDELAAVADGWQDAIRIMLTIMPQIGRETAYNVTTHNTDGAGLYFEFLPYTQEMGGFEHLGLYLCQGNPSAAAEMARKTLERYE
jgi:galactose-1-phosphate uridylyltransferase